MQMSGQHSPRARLTRLSSTRREWIVDYGLWKVHRLEDRFPRDTSRRLAPLQTDISDALLRVTGGDPVAVRGARAEFAELRRQQDEHVDRWGVADSHLSELQYVVTRLLRPAVVVETGVWLGLSSWTMLAAMEASGTGTLVSIDFPPLEETQRVQVGSLVPDRLRHRWDLRLGPSRQLLPEVFAEHPEIDMFVHDSDHTFFNMMREFAQGWEHLVPGGVLLSDDIEANHAFVKFAGRCTRTPIVVPKGDREGYLGLLVR